jgi:hypothetical protein
LLAAKGAVMYPGLITDKVEDKIADIIWGFLKLVAFCIVATFTLIFFYIITLGIMSIVYLLN